jgi:thiol-disulfide isomerase/thioredoxin
VTVPRLVSVLAAGGIVAGLLTACSPAAAPPAEAPPAAAAPAAAAAEPVAPAAVPASLKFTGTTLDGKTFDAATMAGKPTILWFWAPWCATCASEAMSISDLQDEYAGRLNILGIAGMGDNQDMHEFVLDKAGTIVTTGYLDDLQLTSKVKSLVA